MLRSQTDRPDSGAFCFFEKLHYQSDRPNKIACVYININEINELLTLGTGKNIYI